MDDAIILIQDGNKPGPSASNAKPFSNDQGSQNEPETDGQASPGLVNNATVKDNKAVAYNNLAVYMAADKFGLMGLKKLAMKRFVTWLNSHTTYVNLAKIIRAAMVCLPTHGNVLKDAIGEVLSEHVDDVIGLEGMMTIFGEFGSLAPALLKKVLSENAQLRAAKRQLESKLQTAEEIKEMQDTDWKDLSKCINSHSGCRQCGIPFGVRVQGHRFNYRTVRCRKCNTRHDINPYCDLY